jgi:hypothetical protein
VLQRGVGFVGWTGGCEGGKLPFYIDYLVWFGFFFNFLFFKIGVREV